jgi:hypothetical protein
MRTIMLTSAFQDSRLSKSMLQVTATPQQPGTCKSLKVGTQLKNNFTLMELSVVHLKLVMLQLRIGVILFMQVHTLGLLQLLYITITLSIQTELGRQVTIGLGKLGQQ